jgi:hypothetical protein
LPEQHGRNAVPILGQGLGLSQSSDGEKGEHEIEKPAAKEKQRLRKSKQAGVKSSKLPDLKRGNTRDQVAAALLPASNIYWTGTWRTSQLKG